MKLWSCKHEINLEYEEKLKYWGQTAADSAGIVALHRITVSSKLGLERFHYRSSAHHFYDVYQFVIIYHKEKQEIVKF